MNKVNIAIAGGSCTGKSTLAAGLFAVLKEKGFDYDLVTEESRKLRSEIGHFRSPFERFYIWRQQEREELRSTAADGFITDTALFRYYVDARMYATEQRDTLAIRELFRMCLELEGRYQLIVMAKNLDEIPYKIDSSRSIKKERACEKHRLIRSFVEHFWLDRLVLVNGPTSARVEQVLVALKALQERSRPQM